MSGYKNCPACHGVGYLPIEPGSAMTYPCDCTTQVDEVAHMEAQAIEAAEEADVDSIIDDDDDEPEFKTWP